MLWGLQEKPPAKETMGLAPLQGGWTEEVVGGSVRAAEDRVLLGAHHQAHCHQPQEETCRPAACWWHPPLTGFFGWAGFPKLEDLADG